MSETMDDTTPEPQTAGARNGDDETGNFADVLKGLLILPPRQSSKPTGATPALALPPIRADEPVQSLKAALAEVVGLAHITNYRLELESDKEISTVPWKAELVSPFTGKEAVISLPAAVKVFDDEKEAIADPKIVLDDYGDISSAAGLEAGSAVRMVLQRYDAASIVEHVLRLRSLLQGNIPCTTELYSEEQPRSDTKEEAASTDKEETKKPPPQLPDYLDVDANNLEDYFYLACGEDRKLYNGKIETIAKASSKNKKKKGKNGHSTEETLAVSEEQEIREKLPRWNRMDEHCWIKCQIRQSGFHPPPSARKWIGDLAYFEFLMHGEPVLHITASVNGFYINRSSTENGKFHFDPSPAPNPCYSHALLDCLLQASAAFRSAWEEALVASNERAELIRDLNMSSPHLSLFRIAVRGDFDGFSDPAAAAATVQNLDATVHSPSWLVPVPKVQTTTEAAAWSRHHLHSYQASRLEEELMNSFGIDVRTGGSRDWNEEFQLAREMPDSTQQERIERARLLYKVMSEFGEAAVLGVKAIAEGQISPMNPNESMRTQVYLHNNIFFSRAVDAGPDTFKLHRGDKAARKQANRDLQCNQALYRLEDAGISILATVLVDYLGMRYVCQSVLPGILIGERSHKLILGAVESIAPLKYDEDLRSILEEKIAEPMMLASRPVLRQPLSEDRLTEIEEAKKDLPALAPHLSIPTPEIEQVEPNATMITCVPMEAKGIMGSDQRRYLLDIGRFTPRDANWLPERLGGTGKYENEKGENGKTKCSVPELADDEEWALCVLRPELVHRFTQSLVSKYVGDKQAKELEKKKQDLLDKKNSGDGVEPNEEVEKESAKDSNESPESEKEDLTLSKDDLEYIRSIRFNVNVFLPGVKKLEAVNKEMAELIKSDEDRVRAAALFLWDDVLPKITQAIAEGTVHLPVDGRSLTEFLHRNGVNCRYLGRLATLSQEREVMDANVNDALKQGRQSLITRRTMPKYWLELLECEMVARAAKHVLNHYMREHGGTAAKQPAQTVASFLSALVSESEETAAQTETRLSKRPSDEPDDDDFAALSITNVGGGGDAMPLAVRNRTQVWKDIEAEVARRFRYNLTLYNTGKKSGRARYTSLLRRVCQCSGVRLVAKNYELGAKCLCSGGDTFGGRLTKSFPISPLDVVDIFPLVKHTAASNEGFFPCLTAPMTLPPLQVSLQDARVALENAHAQTNARALNKGLELAQEAFTLFQRVTESSNHPGVVEAVDLMATIFHEAGDLPLAIAHGDKALNITIQTFGFDHSNVVNSHINLFQMHYSAKNFDRAVKHLRAGIYLLETMAGANHAECFSALQKLGNTYSHQDYNGQYVLAALKCFDEAYKRDACDRFTEGIAAKQYAKALADAGNYKDAVQWEKKAHSVLCLFLGKDHTWAKESEALLSSYTKSAVERGSRTLQAVKLNEEAAKAEAIAADLLAAEEANVAPKKNKNKKKKGGKK